MIERKFFLPSSLLLLKVPNEKDDDDDNDAKDDDAHDNDEDNNTNNVNDRDSYDEDDDDDSDENDDNTDNNYDNDANNRELTNRRLSHDAAAGSRHSPALPSCRNLNLRFVLKTTTLVRAAGKFSRRF